MTRPIFLTGAPRSGKTLMRWLLSSHSRITVARRAEMWPRFAGGFGDLSHPGNFDRCLSAMLARRQIAWLAPDRDLLRATFGAGEQSYARLFALVHEQHARRNAKARWGDQSERYESCLGELTQAFPGTTVIHLVRDPRDRHEALLARRSARPGDVGRSIAVWLRSVSVAQRALHSSPATHVLVRFEDLVGDPGSTMARVCAAVGESFEPDMLRMGGTDRYDALRTLDGCPLSAEYVGRYRTSLGPHDVAFVQSVAGQQMRALGYEFEDVDLRGTARLRLASAWPANVVRMGAIRAGSRR